MALGGVDATVLAPVPYFPISHPMFGGYSVYARAPMHEVRHGIDVWHPRYPVIPKFGSRWTPASLYRAGLAAVRRLEARGLSFDVIDAHYLYPDGVAAARLASTLKLPVVITGRGTDLTLIPLEPGPRGQIQAAIREASALIAVCDDLGQRLVELGAPQERTLVLRNGVDLDLFSEGDREGCRAALDIKGFVLLSVGSLIARKGHDLAIEAVARRPDCTLLIAGGGPRRAELESLARRLGVSDRVRLLGETPHHELPNLYRAADALVLASEREGWANVLLEAMACGTPVIATDVNGTGEVVRGRAAGLLIRQRTPDAIAETLDRLRGEMPDRRSTRRYAELFGWRPIARANRAILSAAAACGFDGRFADKIVSEGRKYLQEPTEPNSP